MSDLFAGTKKNGMSKAISKKVFFELAAKYDATDEAYDYDKVLKRKKAANSERAWKGRLHTLLELEAAGQSVKAVIAKSADSGWTGLFEVKNERTNGTGNGAIRETARDRAQRKEDAALARAGYGPAWNDHDRIVETPS